MAAIFFLIYIFFENQNFVTEMFFNITTKSDVMVILSKIEISVTDRLNRLREVDGHQNIVDSSIISL